MKKYERTLWLLAVSCLFLALTIMYQSHRQFERYFIAGEDQRELTERSLRLLMHSQRISQNDVQKFFFISYVYFSKETCIRFIPRPGVLGGPISYCFEAYGNHRLLRIDRVA
jgi:hypothetical protein